MPDLSREALGAAVQRARLDAGLTQDELGRRTGLGQTVVSRIESAGRKIDLVELLRIADAVDATVDELLATAAALDEQGQAGAEGADDGRAEPELLALRLGAGADASGAADALGWVPGFVRELRRLEAGTGGGD